MTAIAYAISKCMIMHGAGAVSSFFGDSGDAGNYLRAEKTTDRMISGIMEGRLKQRGRREMRGGFRDGEGNAE